MIQLSRQRIVKFVSKKKKFIDKNHDKPRLQATFLFVKNLYLKMVALSSFGF